MKKPKNILNPTKNNKNILPSLFFGTTVFLGTYFATILTNLPVILIFGFVFFILGVFVIYYFGYENLTSFFKRIYRVSLSHSKQEAVAWKELKKQMANYNCTIDERRKEIVAPFVIDASNRIINCYYFLSDNLLYFDAEIKTYFDEGLITDAFILATHLNNELGSGIVIINAERQSVIFQQKADCLTLLLYGNDYFFHWLDRHHEITTDICWAFDKLISENEEPAIIFADLMRMKDQQAQAQTA